MLTASCLDVFLQEEIKMNVTSTIIKYLFVFIIQLIYVSGSFVKYRKYLHGCLFILLNFFPGMRFSLFIISF